MMYNIQILEDILKVKTELPEVNIVLYELECELRELKKQVNEEKALNTALEKELFLETFLYDNSPEEVQGEGTISD